MKSKSIFKLLLASFALVLFASFADETVAAAASVLPDLFSHSDQLVMAAGPVLVTSLSNINGSSEDSPNPGGTRKLLIAKGKDFATRWPVDKVDIIGGEIVNAPTLKDGCAFAEYQFPADTFELSDDGAGEPGFQSYKHGADFMLAGFNKDLAGELKKHLNSGSVIIGEMNDGQFVVVGSSDNRLYLKASFKSGKKGSDKRGYTVKAEQDGFMYGLLPLSTTAVAALDLLPEA